MQCICPVAVLEGQPSSLILLLITRRQRRLGEWATAIYTHLQPRLSTGPAAGDGTPAFKNNLRYLNLRSLPHPGPISARLVYGMGG